MAFRTCSPGDVSRFETENSIVLPDDYRQFLIFGSDVPENRGLLPPLTKDASHPWGGFGEFCSLVPDSIDQLPSLQPPYGNVAIPENSLVVGWDQAADGPFAMSLDDEDFGAVYWCILGYEWELGDDGRGEKNPDHIIGRSFTEFLQAIRDSITFEEANQRAHQEIWDAQQVIWAEESAKELERAKQLAAEHRAKKKSWNPFR
jgi:hypothetical protein